MRLGAVALLVVLYIYSVRGISFHITPDERKCIREEVHKDVLVVGEYKLSEVPGQRTDLLVSDDTRWFNDNFNKRQHGSCINFYTFVVVVLNRAHFLRTHPHVEL